MVKILLKTKLFRRRLVGDIDKLRRPLPTNVDDRRSFFKLFALKRKTPNNFCIDYEKNCQFYKASGNNESSWCTFTYSQVSLLFIKIFSKFVAVTLPLWNCSNFDKIPRFKNVHFFLTSYKDRNNSKRFLNSGTVNSVKISIFVFVKRTIISFGLLSSSKHSWYEKSWKFPSLKNFHTSWSHEDVRIVCANLLKTYSLRRPVDRQSSTTIDDVA